MGDAVAVSVAVSAVVEVEDEDSPSSEVAGVVVVGVLCCVLVREGLVVLTDVASSEGVAWRIPGIVAAPAAACGAYCVMTLSMAGR